MTPLHTSWPRLMKLKTAASYCDMSVPYYEKLMATGMLPPPIIRDGRTMRFDKRAIDRALDLLSQPQQSVSMGDRRL